MTKYLLTLNGPLCSGKTSTADLLLASEPKLIRISRDKIKRFISDYTPDNHYKIFLDQIMVSFTKQAFENGLNVIIEGSPNLDIIVQLKEIAEKHGAKYVEVNLEAPEDVLIDRFHKRLALAKERDFKMFCTTEERMKELNQKYFSLKNTSAKTIMTDVLSQEEVIQELKKIIE